MQVEWVVGSFNGRRAESVEGHANAGIGYFILEAGGKGSGKTVIAAFRKPCDEPVEDHLQVVTDPLKIQQYEQRLNIRRGIDSRASVRKASDEVVQRVKDIFYKK